MGDPASGPLRLSIVYEPAEQGWITARIPALLQCLSAPSTTLSGVRRSTRYVLCEVASPLHGRIVAPELTEPRDADAADPPPAEAA
jgi:hypothetical protein